MIFRHTIFAAVPWPPWINWVLLAAAILFAGVIAVFVALAFRKKPVRKRKHHHHHSGLKTHNPTLAETGGLPPRREEQDSQTPKP